MFRVGLAVLFAPAWHYLASRVRKVSYCTLFASARDQRSQCEKPLTADLCVWPSCRRHKIIESPKAGRYAQLWCRTCCNCAISSKTIGNLVGCTNTAHWHTVTNRSYHEKTPFHQLAHNLLQASYNEALQARIPFEDAIGLTGQTYYKMAGEKGCEADQQPGGRKGGEGGGGGGKNGKRDRGVEGTDMHQANSGAFFPHGLASMDQHNLFRGMNGGMAGLMSPGPSQAHLQVTCARPMPLSIDRHTCRRLLVSRFSCIPTHVVLRWLCLSAQRVPCTLSADSRSPSNCMACSRASGRTGWIHPRQAATGTCK